MPWGVDSGMGDIAALRLFTDPWGEIAFNTPPTVYRCTPDWYWKPSPLPDYDLWCVLAGRGAMRIDNSDPVPLSAGSCWLIAPGTKPYASHVPDAPLAVFAVHFTAAVAVGTIAQKIADVPFLSMLADRCASAHATESGRLQALSLVRDIFHLMVAEAERGDSHHEHAAQSALLAAIRSEPERRWTVGEMAERMCVSRSQLARIVRRDIGASPMEFVIACRLDRARQLLLETRKSVAEIAAETGYDDPQCFSRQFSARFKISPRAYRERGM